MLCARRAADRGAHAALRNQRGSRADPRPAGGPGERERRHRATYRPGGKRIRAVGGAPRTTGWRNRGPPVERHGPRRADRRGARPLARYQPAARRFAGPVARARSRHRSRPPGHPAAAGRGVSPAEPIGADGGIPGQHRARDGAFGEGRAIGGSRNRAIGSGTAVSHRNRRGAAARIGIGDWRAAPHRRGSRCAPAGCGRTAADHRPGEDRGIADSRAQGIARTGAGAPQLHHRIRSEEDLAARRQAAAELRQTIDQEKTEVSRIRARKESLEQVLAHRSYTTESVKKLFASLETGKAGDLKPAGVLADYVEVDPQYEKPAEEFLHDELEYVVVESWQQAERGLDFIRAELSGRATFLVHPEPNGNGKARLPEPAIGPETGIAARLSDSLRLTNGFRDRATDLLPRVSLCFVAEDRGSAQRLSTAYPHLYFLLPDGVCYHGHTVTGGKKTGAGPLAMKREARELVVVLGERQTALDDRVARLDAISREIVGLEAEVERLRSLQQAREKDRVALDHDVRKLAEDLARANSKVSVARLELERLRRDAEKSAGDRERNRAAVEDKERQRAAREEALEAERQEAEKLEAEAAAIGEDHAATRAALAALEERHRGERNAMGRLQQQFQETANRRDSTIAEIERLGEQRARLLADNIELDRRGAELAAEISRLEGHPCNQIKVR